ncbi:MAG: hypothetical protein JW891_17090 [Candidatus Lokiarchaeota archaeon]|nr:hypothetical protein [Candidatus Lokiarchaeota archaeon]
MSYKTLKLHMSEGSEKNFLVGIFGENFERRNLIGQALGSPGTKSDIQFYNRLDAGLGQVFCALTPIDYPDKIKPFLQTLTITNIHILVIDLKDGLNAVVGELLVGMDMFHQMFDTKPLVVIAGINEKTEWKLEEIKKQVKIILNTTSLKDANILEIKDDDKDAYEQIKKKVIEIGIEKSSLNIQEKHYTKVLIDHVFPVKGIGTVILGVVKNGTLNAGEMVELTGYDGGPSKKIIIRSIQKHDRDFKNAIEGDRVGLALKGTISPADVSRDNMIVSQGVFKRENEITATVHVNQFYKPKGGTIKPGDGSQYYALTELKISPVKLVEGTELTPGNSGEIKIILDKPLVHDGSGLKGVITELNKFENKLRIVGFFVQK